MPFFLLLLVCALINAATGDEVRISSVDELVEFKNNVNSGKNYFGTTVLLESDLSLDEQTFEPIGTDYSNPFLGVFDGQGHVISNLEVESSTSEYFGLFGYSEGLSVRNLILDSSCSVVNSYGSDFAYVGGIVGYCYASNGPCAVESSVNMGSASFNGTVFFDLYLGGFFGYVESSSSNEAVVKNCANYGDVTHSGTSMSSYIGGLIGNSEGTMSNKLYIQISTNQGTITYNGTSTSNTFYIGGIAGYTYQTRIENCVSGGEISYIETGNVGSIAGYAPSSLSISYCFVTSKLSGYKKHTGKTLSRETNTLNYDSTTFELSGTVSIGSYTGTSLIDALNAYADYYVIENYSHWLLNKNKNTVSFTINDRTAPISMSYQIIVLPSLASEGNMSFDGWYEDTTLTKPFTSYEITSDTELYGKWGVNTKSYTITFDPKREGVTVNPITAQFGTAVVLPSISTADGCSVGLWETECGDNMGFSLTVSARNITLYAYWKCTRINTPEDLIDFSEAVSNGVNYSDTTVFLDSDISFAGKVLEPIGTDFNYFRGVFDGQGHVISDLAMNSSTQYAGLFGYSRAAIIRNVILDSSCSITSSFYSSSDNTYVGGIIAYCDDFNGQCIIENNVNMASVSFAGYVDDYLYIGGIVGEISSSSSTYEATMKNCANYGDVTQFGLSRYSYIGGVAGFSFSSSSPNSVSIHNCLNHGAIIHNGTVLINLYIGGLIGCIFSTNVENCVGAGKITTSNSSKASYIGVVVGRGNVGTSIMHCLWTSDAGSYDVNGTGISEVADSSLITTLDATTMNDLNEYAEIKNSTWSKWAVLHLNGGTVSNIDPDTPISGLVKSLPVPVKEMHRFDFWCVDEACSSAYNASAAAEMSSVTELYAHWTHNNQRTLTFEGNGGSVVGEGSKSVIYNVTYGELPRAERVGHTFAGWYTGEASGEEVRSDTVVSNTEDHTLYARWTVNNYTVTFDFSNGTALRAAFPFNATIEYPDGMVREGLTFREWTPRPERMPAENVTVAAQWAVTEPRECVRVVLSKINLSPEGVKKAIREFTAGEGADFDIVMLESDSSETTAVVRFSGAEDARGFVEAFWASSGTGKSAVKSVDFVTGCSFSPSLSLSVLVYLVSYHVSF